MADSSPLKYDEPIAIQIPYGGSASWLCYTVRDWGINLGWGEAPQLQWRITGGDAGAEIAGSTPCGLYNTVAGDHVIYCERPWGINLRWANDCSDRLEAEEESAVPATVYDDSPTRWQFADMEDLVDYVGNLFEIEPQSKRSIRASGSHIRSLRKNETSSSNAALFHDPFLDHITSSHGELMIGSRSFNMLPRRVVRSSRGIVISEPPTSGFTSPRALSCYTDERGWQVCRSDDGSLLKFTLPNGTQSISFESFMESFWLVGWKAGARIETHNLNFIAADITSRYYFRAEAQTCAPVIGYDDDATSWSMEESEEGFGAEEPIRVESLCRVQWHGRRFSGVVSTGEDCFGVGVQPWPDGYPAHWPPLGTA